MLCMKKFRKRKMQSILIMFMVLFCAMLMTSSMVILTSLQKPYQDLQKETKAPNAKVYPLTPIVDNEASNWGEELERLSTVSRVVEVKRHTITQKVLHQGNQIEAFLALGKYNSQIYENIRYINQEGERVKGEGPKQGECFIPAVLANEYGILVGDKLVLSGGEQEDVFTVAAIFADPYSMNLSYQVEILVNEIPMNLGHEYYYAVYGTEDTNGTDIVVDYLNYNNGILDARFYSMEECMNNSSITEKILGGILLALSIIVFLVSSIMIRYMIKNALIQDNKTIAILKAIGYDTKDIMAIYLKFYLFIAATGSLIGIILSAFISNSFMKRAYANIGEVSSPNLMAPGIICILLINGVVYLQIYFVLNKMKKLKPVIALNGRETYLGVRKAKQHRWTEKLSFSPLGMALRMIQRDKKNTIYIILTCFVSIFMVNFALVAFSNIDSMTENNYYWIGFDKHDVSVTATSLEEFEAGCNILLEDPEVERVIKSNMEVGIIIKWQKGLGFAVVYETFEDIHMPVVKGRNPKYSDEVVLSNLLAIEMNKEIGDYIDIYLKEDIKASFLIVGTYQSFYNMGKGVRMLGSTFQENGVDIVYNEASVYLYPKVDANKFVEKYQEQFKNSLKIVVRDEKYGNIISNITEPQKVALGPFMALVVFIGGLNLLYIIYLKNCNNRKTYSIYKSIGYSANHLVHMNLWYVGIIAFLSMMISIPIFVIAFPKIMVLAMSVFGFEDYLVNYNIPIMMTGNLGAILVFLLAVLLSSKMLYENLITELNQE